MITRWYWVRHAPTHATTALGWTDVGADLSDKPGLARLDIFLPRPALLVASDLRRASATADALGNGRTRLPNQPALRESNHGEWEGLAFGHIASLHPELSREYWNNPGDAAPPGGESWNDLTRRVSAFTDRMNTGAPDQIVAVAHAGVILCALYRAAGMPARAALAFVIDPLSVTCLEYLHDSGQWRITGVNHRA